VVALGRHLTNLGFLRFFHVEAPSSVLTLYLITIRVCCGKAVEIAFVPLLFVDGRGGDFDKTSIAQGGAEGVRAPRNDRFLFPLLAAPNTFDVQCVHGVFSAAYECSAF